MHIWDPGLKKFGSGVQDAKKIRSGMEKIRIRDPEWKKFGSGIWNKHPGSATLQILFC
jgi:hypothetical protein